MRPVLQHSQIWRAIDNLAERRGLTASGLARAAGLDPTTFNRSKRIAPDGRPRWPSTESLAMALEATGVSFEDFAATTSNSRRTIPIIGLARAGADGFFDDAGFPASPSETVRFPDVEGESVYALEVTGDSMAPLYREGDIVVVRPGIPARRGDRVVVRTRAGEVMAKELGRRSEQSIELISLNPAYAPRTLAAGEIDWISRIVWASQ